MTHVGYGGLNTFDQPWVKLIIVIIILNQIPLVLVDVLKEYMSQLMFKHTTKISISYIWLN